MREIKTLTLATMLAAGTILAVNMSMVQAQELNKTFVAPTGPVEMTDTQLGQVTAGLKVKGPERIKGNNGLHKGQKPELIKGPTRELIGEIGRLQAIRTVR